MITPDIDRQVSGVCYQRLGKCHVICVPLNSGDEPQVYKSAFTLEKNEKKKIRRERNESVKSCVAVRSEKKQLCREGAGYQSRDEVLGGSRHINKAEQQLSLQIVIQGC